MAHKIKDHIIRVLLWIPLFFVILFSAIISIFICDRTDEKTIHKGFRRPLFTIPFCLPRYINTLKTFRRKILFSPSCITQQTHTNKLFGFSVGGIKSIHKNSFRFGFATKNGKLYAGAYYYIKGVRGIDTGLRIYPNKKYIFTIKRSTVSVKFTIENDGFVFYQKEITFVEKKRKGLKLGLYYGGKPKAPHTIQLTISK